MTRRLLSVPCIAAPFRERPLTASADLTSLTIAEIRDGLAAKRFSAVELTTAYLAAMEQARSLNACIVTTPEKALARWPRIRMRVSPPAMPQALEGVSLGIKDLFATKGVHTQAVEPHPAMRSSHLQIDGDGQPVAPMAR